MTNSKTFQKGAFRNSTTKSRKFSKPTVKIIPVCIIEQQIKLMCGIELFF